MDLPWAGDIKRYLEFLGGVCGGDTEHEASVERILSLASLEGDKPMHHPVSFPMAHKSYESAHTSNDEFSVGLLLRSTFL